jgi:hypothetical protein
MQVKKQEGKRSLWQIQVQSNLCTAATLGTLKLRLLLTGGRCSQVRYIVDLKLGLSNGGLCRQVAVIQRWPLAQVLLYSQKLGKYGYC